MTIFRKLPKRDKGREVGRKGEQETIKDDDLGVVERTCHIN